MRQLNWLACLALATVFATEAQAGCGLFRRGGCSDPCAAASCGGFGVSSCSSCSGAISPAGCAACGTQANSVPSACGSCGTAQSAAVAGSGCGACGQIQSAVPAPMQAIVSTQQNDLLDCGPVQSFKVVMEPKYFTESKAVCTTEYRDEIRYRTRTVPRQVPVEVQDYRTTTVIVPKTETKTVDYTVLVPQKKEKTVELVETVPVWNEVTDSYTVRVPTLVDVSESYTVKVAQLSDEQFTYTVYVPQAQTETKIQTVTNAVPVVKSRIIQVCRPVTRMKTVTKDYGHWEVRTEEVTAAVPTVSCGASANVRWASGGIRVGGCGTYSGSCAACGGCGQTYVTLASGCRASSNCRSCGGCGVASVQTVSAGCACGTSNCVGAACGQVPCGSASGCGPARQTAARRVWVPNVVTEQVPVVENVSEAQEVTYTAFEQHTEEIPYECTYMVYVPEERTGTRKVVDYVDETRTRTRKVVQYNEESRTRTRKELSYKQVSRTETIPYVTYTTEKRTKEVSYTVNVPETKVEPITTTRYDTVNEEITEEYSVRVPFASSKEVQVQVCRMVPKLVPVTIYPCSSNPGVISAGALNGGCANCGGTPTMAPSPTTAGCAACAAAGSPCSACQGQ